MTTLYATDLDGTLLDAYARLSAYTAARLRELTAKGALITFVTARTPATIEPILAPAAPVLPGVAMTGASIWNPLHRAYDDVTYHAPDDVHTVTGICHRGGVTPFVYTMAPGTNVLDVYHASPLLTKVEEKFVTERTINDLKRFHLRQQAPQISDTHTVLFFAMGDPEKIKNVAEEIRRNTSCYASWYPDTYNPGLSLLEVFAPGVSKARGILTLKKRLRADRLVVFGDNLNDIPMLEAADVAVAVDNARPEVKEVAKTVIGPNTADSVVNYIMQQENLY